MIDKPIPGMKSQTTSRTNTLYKNCLTNMYFKENQHMDSCLPDFGLLDLVPDSEVFDDIMPYSVRGVVIRNLIR